MSYEDKIIIPTKDKHKISKIEQIDEMSDERKTEDKMLSTVNSNLDSSTSTVKEKKEKKDKCKIILIEK